MKIRFTEIEIHPQLKEWLFKKNPNTQNDFQKLWNDWGWQLRNSLKNEDDFTSVFKLSSDEKAVFNANLKSQNEIFNIRTTPYYANLALHFGSPIRKILMPHSFELKMGSQQMDDPLAEKKHNPVSRIVHRYSDRVLFLVTDICSVYCRYCTRKHFTGHEQAFINNDEYAEALEYIKNHEGVREVILSGGDPLTLSNQKLDQVLSDIRKIEHIEIIRLGSRIPVVCPQRIDEELVQILKKHKPVFLMTHFNHPDEITLSAADAVEKFVDNGIPVMNQMVLLNGVNNHPAIVQALARRLLFLRAKPYYMFQCDPSVGTDHLRTSIEESEEIQKELWGHLSGLAMPQLSVDIPNGGGKTTLAPQFEIGRLEGIRYYKGWDGVKSEYINPESILKEIPEGFQKYLPEWELLKNSKK